MHGNIFTRTILSGLRTRNTFCSNVNSFANQQSPMRQSCCSLKTQTGVHRSASILDYVKNQLFNSWKSMRLSYCRKYHDYSGSSKSWLRKAFILPTAACAVAHKDQDDTHIAVTAKELESAVEDLTLWLQQALSDKKGTQTHDDWTLVWQGSSTTIWSRPMNGIFQYKIHGHYSDIPAIVFLYVQMDVSHRHRWDTSTDVVQHIKPLNENDETEYIYWRVLFPRLMSPRDYVYARRHLIDLDKNVLLLFNRSVEHPDKPAQSKYVRVTDYMSKMIIKPHGSYLENGFDYILTYYDDTKVKMPTYAYNKLVKSTLPTFLEKVHHEAQTVMKLYKKTLASGGNFESADSRVKDLHKLMQEAAGQQTSTTVSSHKQKIRKPFVKRATHPEDDRQTEDSFSHRSSTDIPSDSKHADYKAMNAVHNTLSDTESIAKPVSGETSESSSPAVDVESNDSNANQGKKIKKPAMQTAIDTAIENIAPKLNTDTEKEPCDVKDQSQSASDIVKGQLKSLVETIQSTTEAVKEQIISLADMVQSKTSYGKQSSEKTQLQAAEEDKTQTKAVIDEVQRHANKLKAQVKTEKKIEGTIKHTKTKAVNDKERAHMTPSSERSAGERSKRVGHKVDAMDNCSVEEKEMEQFQKLSRIPVQKIRPPRYLPDLKQIVINLFTEGKIKPITYKEVGGRHHPAQQYPTYKSKEDRAEKTKSAS